MNILIRNGAALCLLLGVFVGCDSPGDADFAPPVPASPPPLSLLALGDSYTVGEAVPAAWSWPAQLADSLAAAGDTLAERDLLAVTGWTTRDLLDALRTSGFTAREPGDGYGLVTLLIGVNNQFQGLDPAIFPAELDTLLDLATGLADGDPSRVLGISIPDYGVTPVGQLLDPVRIGQEIDAYNRILGSALSARGIALVDVTELSRRAAEEPDLVARDGLHYSREMYRRWVGILLPEVRRSLQLDPVAAGDR